MLWLCASRGVKCKYFMAATATFTGFKSASPSCSIWYLLNFCNSCKANRTDLWRSAVRSMLKGNNRPMARQVCFLSPDPPLANAFWQCLQWSRSLRLQDPGFWTGLFQCPICFVEQPHLWQTCCWSMWTSKTWTLCNFSPADFSIAAQKRKQAHLRAEQLCSSHAQEHTWGGLLRSSQDIAGIAFSTQAHTILASSVAKSSLMAAHICLWHWPCSVFWQ